MDVICLFNFVFDLVSLDERVAFPLGTQNSAQWSPGGLGGYPSISYSNGEKQTIVTLQCSIDGTSEFEVLGEAPINVYKFRLTDRCACWNGCTGE